MDGVKRAITLAGGGPTAGLQIGALRRFEEEGLTFDVWAMSCIGAWVGSVYHQFAEDKAQQTEDFFREHIFCDDASYSRFPINHAFGPPLQDNADALVRYLCDPASYRNLVLPGAAFGAVQRNWEFVSHASRWSPGDLNALVLENLAVNPIARYLVSMMYLSEVTGLTKIYYPDSSFLRHIDFKKLKTVEPFLYHNAYNLRKSRLELFANRPEDVNPRIRKINKELHDCKREQYREMNARSVCACSALPYIEQPVEIDGQMYCEGALVDTVNFKDLLYDHGDLQEVWVVRIVGKNQIKEPENLCDALGNLIMLFAATVGEDDVKLFGFHAKEDNPPWKEAWHGEIVELEVSDAIDYDWSHSNLEKGVEAGYKAADAALVDHLSKT
jgi:predicted acylesterase/phospholipase RssA